TQVLERMRGFLLFKDCSDDFIAALASIATARPVAMGTVILTEGTDNDRLLILAKGRVEVRVANEKVATIATPGDLMGEISVFARRKVTASLRAMEDVELFEIGSAALSEQVRTNADFGARLYQLFSEILSDKIIQTNAKARQFEIANRSLVDINRTLDQKVQERTDATFRKLQELETSLNPLLTLVREQKDPRALAQLETTLETLRGLEDFYTSERASRGRQVLVVEPDRKQQTIARMSLGGTGVKLKTAATPEEATAELDRIKAEGARHDVIFVSSDLSSLLAEIEKREPDSRVVLMAPGDIGTVLPIYKAHSSVIKNLITRNPEDRMFTVKTFATAVTKLVTRDLFGLEKYMMWGIEAQERPITTSTERTELIEQMQDHLKSLGVRGTIGDRAATVAEELLMNAIYDAPVDATGSHHYGHLPRTTPVDLKPEEHGRFRFACDGMLAAISVSDPFGVMQMKTLFDYLERNLTSDGGNVQSEGKGGAGRGLHQIVESSDLVVFNVQAGTRTEVIAFFNLDPNAKNDGTHRSFQFFQG
ncbi:MAG: cyclic nucleotide-binding domain-containing protein, partial [Bdellovibrionota bacterium]